VSRRTLLLPSLLLLAACGVEVHRSDPPNTVHLALVAEIAGLDPAQAQEGVSSACVLQIYDTLYEYHHLLRPYVLRPCLAASMPEVSEDGLVHTIRLKHGVRFQDDPCFPDGRGRELTADDVVFCFKRLMDAKTASPGTFIFDGYVEGLDEFRDASSHFHDEAGEEGEGGEEEEEDDSFEARMRRIAYPDVSGVRAPDRYTVQIRLKAPYPQIHYALAMPFTCIYPPEAISCYGDEFLNHPVGTGPFVVESFKRTQRLVLRKNPTYREDFYPSEGMPDDEAAGRLADAGKRLPLCNRLVFTVYKESQPLWLDFLLGNLDRAGIPKDQFDNAVDPATRELRTDLADRGVRLEKTPEIEVIYDCFNMHDPVVGAPNGEKGKAIRRAMSLAFNEEWARAKLYNDRLDSLQGVLVPEFPEYDPTFVNPWKKRPDETREQALARARKLLADAGYTDPEHQIPPIYYEVTDSVTDSQFYAVLKRDMEGIGIDLRATRVTWTQLMKRIDQGDAQMWGLAWVADYPDAQNFLSLFYGPNKAPGPNGASYENPEFDRLYERALALGPCPERTELYRAMQKIVVEDCVWIFKYRRVTYDLLQPWFHNFKRSALQDRYGKYVWAESEERTTTAAVWNRPVLTPLWIALALVGLVVGLTLWGARRRVRAW